MLLDFLIQKDGVREFTPEKVGNTTGAFPYARQRRAAAAAATYITIYGIIITGLLPYMIKWVAAAAAARCCRVYGKAP